MTTLPPAADDISVLASPPPTSRTPMDHGKRFREVGAAGTAPGTSSGGPSGGLLALDLGVAEVQSESPGGCDSAHKSAASPTTAGPRKRQRPSSPTRGLHQDHSDVVVEAGVVLASGGAGEGMCRNSFFPTGCSPTQLTPRWPPGQPRLHHPSLAPNVSQCMRILLLYFSMTYAGL
jgi:hypothetical protein